MKSFKSYITEGRPSQRHPLEGHEYHRKTDAELVHIAKDAHKAAEAMKSHNTQAENKYRDQANDSATVRHFRQKSGMPDWYKKKYGHMKEETDTTEKVEMVQSQLHFIKYACEEILDYIEQGGEVEEWYQVKVAKSFSEFESLHAFIEGESRRTGMKEEVEKFPFVAVHAKKGMHQTHGNTSYEAAQNAAKHWKMKSTAGIDVHRADKKHVATESVEQIDEMSNDDKSSVALKALVAKKNLKQSEGKYKSPAFMKKMQDRVKAGDKLKEEVDQIDELSKDTLKSYADKATSSKDIWGNPKKSYLNRVVGISRASEKLKKEETELDSLSPASMTLKEKPNKELMPKLKQEQTNTSVPFEGSKPKKGVVTDKSGAKHGTMSRVRDIARQALKKQSEKMKPVKESLDESRKAEIIKEVMKKKKDEIKLKNDEKFQSEPVLSSQIVKENK